MVAFLAALITFVSTFGGGAVLPDGARHIGAQAQTAGGGAESSGKVNRTDGGGAVLPDSAGGGAVLPDTAGGGAVLPD